jgi:hypothetical protein
MCYGFLKKLMKPNTVNIANAKMRVPNKTYDVLINHPMSRLVPAIHRMMAIGNMPRM